MANEFVARKGLIVLANGAKITGSLDVSGAVSSSVGFSGSGANVFDVDFNKLINKPALISSSAQFSSLSGSFTGSFTGSFFGDGSNLTGIATVLTVSGSTGSDTINLKTEALTITGSGGVTATVTNNTVTIGVSGGFVSSSSQLNLNDLNGTLNVNKGGTGQTTLTSGAVLLGNGTNPIASASRQNISGDTKIIVTGGTGAVLTATTLSLGGGVVSSSVQIDHDATTNFVANEHVDHTTVSITAGAGLNGGGDISATRTLSVNSGSMLPYYSSSIFGTVSGDILITAAGVASIQANSVALGTDTTGDYVSTITAGNGIATTGASSGETIAHTISLNTSSAHFTNGVKAKLNTDGVYSSSAQIVASGFATTASNTFTGIQTISNTTNSTNYTNGALIVQGGVGIAKDVNISGSLTVVGLLTAVTMSTQYVTSSEYTIGTSRIVLNDDDLVRFAGLSVIDSGSTFGTGSLLWDSFNNRWIAETDDVDYESATIILGPKNVGALGDEPVLVNNRIPVGFSDHHIDNRLASSSIRVDFPSRLTHIEAGVYITGSVTSSVGFSGDGSNLTGLVTNLNIAANGGGTSQVSLKTETLQISGSNGIVVTAAGDGFTVSGSDATTTTKGVASFTGSNFTTAGGVVSARPINFNGTDINLGGTNAFGLQNITPYGASTSDQVTLSGGAIISSILYTSANNLDVDTGTEVVASIPTGSYDAAHFDYVVKKAGSRRTGTVMVIWESGTANVEYTDTSTNDLGNTSEVIFTADTLSGNVRLLATVSTTDWAVKTAARLI